jgi:predicted dehydrogenase
MPAIAEALIARKIPFALEKPCGVNMSQVTRLRKLAEEANVYCAIPFIFRISDLLAALKDAEGQIPSSFNYMSFRFIVGAPNRYEASRRGLGARSRVFRWWIHDQRRYALHRPLQIADG